MMQALISVSDDRTIIIQNTGNDFYCVSLCKNKYRKISSTTEIIASDYASIQIRADGILSLMKEIKNDYDWYYKKAQCLNQEAADG